MHKLGVVAGVVAGVMDVVLIAVADAAAGVWVMAQSFLFWAVAGWLVVVSPSRLGPLLHGVAVTVLLNLPWYVAFGPGAGHVEHVPPLIVMSIVFGLGFGVVRKKAA
ncbi:MAG: hypothetical protein JNM69_10995 [Archangium sp.]|nr:hypothetical protein [Archangium sp.]